MLKMDCPLRSEVVELRKNLTVVTEVLILFQEFIENEIGEMSYFRDSGSYNQLVETFNKIRVLPGMVPIADRPKTRPILRYRHSAGNAQAKHRAKSLMAQGTTGLGKRKRRKRHMKSGPQLRKNSINSGGDGDDWMKGKGETFGLDSGDQRKMDSEDDVPFSNDILINEFYSLSSSKAEATAIATGDGTVSGSLTCAASPVLSDSNACEKSQVSKTPKSQKLVNVEVQAEQPAAVTNTTRSWLESGALNAVKNIPENDASFPKQLQANEATLGIPGNQNQPAQIKTKFTKTLPPPLRPHFNFKRRFLNEDVISSDPTPSEINSTLAHSERMRVVRSCNTGHRPSPLPSPAPPKCEYCNKIYSSQGVKRRHIKERHQAEPQYKCCYCPSKFRTGSQRLEHAHTVHPNEMNSVTYPYCNRVANSVQGKRIHMMTCRLKKELKP